MAVQGDVRSPEQLREAVAKTIQKFGRIDFVICGKWYSHGTRLYIMVPGSLTMVGHSGAAGNFLAPISGLSENGFKTVVDIDTVSIL